MVNPNLDIVVKLEQKIDKLVESYKSEKEENKMLRTQIAQLSSQLSRALHLMHYFRRSMIS